jgi:hypothetical protein
MRQCQTTPWAYFQMLDKNVRKSLQLETNANAPNITPSYAVKLVLIHAVTKEKHAISN